MEEGLEALVIGTRGSKLALIQAESVRGMLQERLSLDCSIKVIHTAGDEDRAIQLSETGQPGQFTRAIEKQLAQGEIDLAVHSLKDLPLKLLPGTALAAIPTRGEVGDVLLVRRDAYYPSEKLFPVRINAQIGTSAPRRQAEIKNVRSDISMIGIRGNFTTRIEKLNSTGFDGTVLAAAGIKRLRFKENTTIIIHHLDISFFVPSPGQGALAVQMREDNKLYDSVREALNDAITESCVTAERDLLQMFGGGCSLPLGVLVIPEDEQFKFFGFWHDSGKSMRTEFIESNIKKGIKRLYKCLKDGVS